MYAAQLIDFYSATDPPSGLERVATLLNQISAGGSAHSREASFSGTGSRTATLFFPHTKAQDRIDGYAPRGRPGGASRTSVRLRSRGPDPGRLHAYSALLQKASGSHACPARFRGAAKDLAAAGRAYWLESPRLNQATATIDPRSVIAGHEYPAA